MTFVERFRFLMERENLNCSAFAQRIGVSQGTIAHIMNGRNRYPSTEVLMKILDQYPDVNASWLISGKGECSLNADGQAHSPADTASQEPQEAPLMPDMFPMSQVEDKPLQQPQDASQAPSAEAKEAETSSLKEQSKAVCRRIREILVFYDDNTYEIMMPHR